MKSFEVSALTTLLGITFFLLTNAGSAALVDIQYIDFKNFTYRNSNCEDIPKEIPVIDGSYKTKASNYEISFSIGDIIYSDINSDGIKDAVIVGWCEIEGANYWPFQIFIYSLKNGKPILIDTLTEERMAHDYERFYPNSIMWQLQGIKYQNGFLSIDRLSDGAHCCPEYITTSNYQLIGNQLTIVGRPTKKRFQ